MGSFWGFGGDIFGRFLGIDGFRYSLGGFSGGFLDSC